MSLWNIEEGGSAKKMTRVNNEKMAKKIAKEDGLLYGMSVFGGKWYTGTREQLKKIGVVKILGESTEDVMGIPLGALEECACSLEGNPVGEGASRMVGDSLYDEIMLVAENEGDFYRKNDAKGAVIKAINVTRRAHMEDFDDKVRGFKKKMIAELGRSWRQTRR